MLDHVSQCQLRENHARSGKEHARLTNGNLFSLYLYYHTHIYIKLLLSTVLIQLKHIIISCRTESLDDQRNRNVTE